MNEGMEQKQEGVQIEKPSSTMNISLTVQA